MLCKISGRRCENAMADTDLLAHIRRIWQRTSNHNRDVKLLFEQVGHSLRQEKIDRYVGIGTPIRERGTRNEAASYTRNRMDAQFAAWLQLGVTRLGFRLLYVREDRDTAFIKASSRV